MARHLTAEQQAEADRIEQRLTELVRGDLRELAEHLASRPDAQLLGATEYEVRDRVHKIGARALEAALSGREKGATAGPARAARVAASRPSSSAIGPGRSSACSGPSDCGGPTTTARPAMPGRPRPMRTCGSRARP